MVARWARRCQRSRRVWPGAAETGLKGPLGRGPGGRQGGDLRRGFGRLRLRRCQRLLQRGGGETAERRRGEQCEQPPGAG
jgi:hypothetical protein